LQLAQRTGIVLQVAPETAEGDVDLETLEHMLRGEYQYDSRAQSSVIPPESVTTALRSSSSQLPRGTISKPVLVAINHVPTSSGKIYDAEAIGILTERYGVPYLLDACQSAGQIPLDVEKLRCDFLTATVRRLFLSFFRFLFELVTLTDVGFEVSHADSQGGFMTTWSPNGVQIEKQGFTQVCSIFLFCFFFMDAGAEILESATWQRVPLLSSRAPRIF
jgi:hypothetical protein